MKMQQLEGKRSRSKKRSRSDIPRRFFYLKQRRKCDFCRKYFFNETILLMHKKTSCTKLWPYVCDKCGNRYKNKGRLREHMLSKCETEKVFACKVCNKSYLYERQLVEHTTPVCKNSGLFRCDFCNYVFKSLQRLNEHILSRCDSEKVFKCDTCKKRYVLKSQLVEHLTPICRAIRLFKCECCERTFKKASALNYHKESFHGIGQEILCDKCGAVLIGSVQFKIHNKKHFLKKSSFDLFDLEEKNYVCKLCGKSLRTKDSLRAHLRNHNDGNMIACNICRKSFSKSSIRSHMRSHTKKPNAPKAFPCSLCGKEFERRKYLDRHMARHSSDKPHYCRDCGRSFATIDQLNLHSAVHSGMNSEICHICGKSFFNITALKRHVQRVHLRKKNSCLQYGKTFKTFQEVEDHHRYEPRCTEIKLEVGDEDVKPHICTDCETCFESLESLLFHTGVNISEQPLQCNTCGKCFSRITCLNSHLLSHPSTLNCDKCKESFEDPLTLALHDAICGLALNDSDRDFTLPTSDDKSCICNNCGDSFNNVYDLTCHALTHIDYERLQIESDDLKFKNEDLCEYANFQNEMIDTPLDLNSIKALSENISDCYSVPPMNGLAVKIESNNGDVLPLERFNRDETLEKNNERNLNHQDNTRKDQLFHPRSYVQKTKVCCHVCGKCLAHSRSLKRHMSVVHPNFHNKMPKTSSSAFVDPVPEVNTLHCKICGETFKNVENSLNHFCQENRNVEKIKLQEVNYIELNEPKEKLHQNNSFDQITDPDDKLTKQDTVKFRPENVKKPEENSPEKSGYKQVTEPVVTSRVLVCEIKGLNHITCKRCGNFFTEIQHMNSHNCKVQPVPNNDNLQSSDLNQTNDSSRSQSVCISERKLAVCDGCGKTFSEARNLKRHVCKLKTTQSNTHHNRDREQESSLSAPIIGSNRKPITCQICGKNFKEAKNLRRHFSTVHANQKQANLLQSHSNNNDHHPSPFSDANEIKVVQAHFEGTRVSFSMPLLNSTDGGDFNGELSAPQQEKSSHDINAAKKSHECNKCKKPFSDLKTLRTHYEKIHSKPVTKDPLKCNVCGKVFQQRYNLTRHKLTHVNNTSFKCSVCGKPFRQENMLQSHMAESHRSEPSTSSLPHDECGVKYFADQSKPEDRPLQDHQKYACDHCGISFQKCSSLLKHQIVAHGEKSKCSLCHLVCASTGALLEHIRFIHKEFIDGSSPFEDVNGLGDEKVSLFEKTRNSREETSTLETKRVELKLPLNDQNMIMFEAYESLLLENFPLEPSVSTMKVNGNHTCDSTEEELVKLEYVIGS